MGKYVNNNLIPGESVIYETSYHWIIYLSLRTIYTLGIGPYIDRSTCEFVITNKRIIIKKGWINKKTFELNLSKIESVNVDQGFIGRIFGYGTVRVVGTGGSSEIIENIKNPLEFRKKFQESTL